MQQINIRKLRRETSRENLKAWMPCEIVSEGEVIAYLLSQKWLASYTRQCVEKGQQDAFEAQVRQEGASKGITTTQTLKGASTTNCVLGDDFQKRSQDVWSIR